MTENRLNSWNPLLLGAGNGALYALVVYLLISASRAYFQDQYVRQATKSGFPIVQFGSNERWTGIVIALVTIFALSTYLVSRISHGLRTPILWMLVGVIAVSGWNALMLIVTWVEKEGSAQTLTYEWVTSPLNPLYGPISLGIVLIVSFIYGCAIRIFERTTAARVS
jgi:hypothetical protein